MMPEPIPPDTKALAEIRKLEAETAKLEAEIRDLNRKPWQRPAAWVALGSGLVAIVAGLITIPTGYFDRIKTIAEQREKISTQTVELNEIKNALELHKLQDKLDATKGEEASIEKEEAAATNRLEAAERNRAGLQRDLGLTPIRYHLDGLEKTYDLYRAFPLTRGNLKQAVKAIGDELSISDPYSATRRKLVADTADRLASKPEIVGLLLHALEIGAKDSSRRAQFLAIAAATAYPPTMAPFEFPDLPGLPFELAVLGPYPDDQKAKLIRDVTAAVGASEVSRFSRATRYYVVAGEDETLLDLCADPFALAIAANRDLAFDALTGSAEAKANLRMSPEVVFTMSWSNVDGLSPQAASIYLAYLATVTHTDLRDRVAFRFGGRGLPMLRDPRYALTPERVGPATQLPAPFGNTMDQLRVTEWPQWLRAHRALVDFWLEPDLRTLRGHPELMKKAVRGVWIEDVEIPKGGGGVGQR